MANEEAMVVKFGGSAFTAEALGPFARRIAELVGAGRRLVVVHGGGKDLSALLERLGKKAEFVEGLRVTDEETLDAAELVFSGRVNKRLVRALAREGLRAVGIAGTDGGLLTAAFHPPVRTGTRGTVQLADLGRVGTIANVDPHLIETLWNEGFVPVVSPLATGPDGEALNINADTAAGAISGALGAELRFLTDVPGILGLGGSVLVETNPDEIAQLRRAGVIRDGMVPKVEACLEALAKGSPRVIVQSHEAFSLGNDTGTKIARG